MSLHHRPGCDPRERTPRTCPCGLQDEFIYHLEGLADALEALPPEAKDALVEMGRDR